MIIKSARFIVSSPHLKNCPEPDKPEYAFIGRSNVGKSSLINMLCNVSDLAKTSGKPGKTLLINHFLINETWYLVDLPGYGFAKVSKKIGAGLESMIKGYLLRRPNLLTVFQLIDSRHAPQKNDLDFMRWMGESGIPFSIIFTKTDKETGQKIKANIEHYKNELRKDWEELPGIFLSSAEKGAGKDEILNYIEQTNTVFKQL